MKPFRAIIVDDEPLARDRVRRLLANDHDFIVVAECADGFEAVRAIDAHEPELVFLDVKMPAKDGFEVLDDITAPVPVIIFLTAFDDYALRAFESQALDYLLKPFAEDRFATALDRAKVRLLSLVDDASIPLSASPPPPAGGHLRRIVVRTEGKLVFVPVDQIACFVASGNYVELQTPTRRYIVRDTLTALEAQLDPTIFVRVHRSALVNFERIRELQPLFHGQFRIVLEGGHELTMSRRYRANLERIVGRPLS